MFFFDTCIRAFVKGNLGDDLFIHVLCERYPNTHFWLCGEKKFRHCFSSLPNLSYVSVDSGLIKWLFRIIYILPFSVNFLLRKLHRKNLFVKYTCFDFISRHSRHNVLISGSIFMEAPGHDFSMSPYYKKEQRYYKSEPYVIGCNFGPYHSLGYLEFYANCFKDATQVCFRDNYSFSLFNGNNIQVAPDILFCYPSVAAIKPELKDYILISVINLNKDGENNSSVAQAYIEALKKVIATLISYEQNIVLMGFCRDQKDDAIITQLQEFFSEYSRLYAVNYPDISCHEATGYLAGAKYIIASRYHAMILGWLFGKKVFPISYNEKMQHVIEDLAPDTFYITTDSLDTLNSTDIWEDILSSHNTFTDINSAVENAFLHFSALDKILK